MTSTLVGQRYRLIEQLGSGGMGVVWLARDEVLGRDVAVKEVVPPPGLSPDEREQVRRRTHREARAAARLNHANVVRVYDVIDGPEAPWIVMEYVPSRSLQQAITQDGPLPEARVAAIGLDVLAALNSAHRAGVLHRDVKPGNVLLAGNGRVVLTDFGLATVAGEAAVTRPGLVIGSPGYISPERAAGEPGGPESDLWSLAATLYTAVEGRGPFDRDSAMATLTAVATAPPDPPRHAGKALKKVFDGLLHKDPASRIGVAEVERLLRQTAAPSVAPAVAPVQRRSAPLPPYQPVPSTVVPSRRGRASLIIALMAAAALALAMFALLPRDDPSGGVLREPPPATSAEVAPQTTEAAPPSLEPAQPPVEASPALPAGWHLYRDPTGFAVAVPDGWQKSQRGSIVYFREPGGGRLLGIDQTNQPKMDPVADWTAQESYRVRRGDFPGYQRIRIEECDYFVACADWEFRYSRTHVNNRGFVVSNTQAYGIWWSTPESQWTDSLPMLETVFRTFQPRR